MNKIVEKSWGTEHWIVNDEKNDYCSKILTIEPGNGTSLHFHSKKHETFHITEGTLELTVVNTVTAEHEKISLNEGDTYVLERNVPHCLESISGCKVLEISTFHRDSDSFRVARFGDLESFEHATEVGDLC